MKAADLLATLQAYLELIRIRNCVLGFVGVVLGAILVSQSGLAEITSWSVGYAAISAALILGAGNAINDYFDFEIDKVNKPHRPLPSKRVSRSDAVMLAIAMFLLGLGLAKAVNGYCLGIAVFNTLLLVAYARYSKGVVLLSNLTVSYLVGSVFIYGALSTMAPGQNPLAVPGIKLTGILAICAFLMTFSRELIKDIEDVEGDQQTYSSTIPIHFGHDTARRFAFLFTFFAILLSVLPAVGGFPGFAVLRYLIIVGIADALFLVSYTMHESLAQRVMVAGMSFALVAFFAGALL